jgi:hypothetical protein
MEYWVSKSPFPRRFLSFHHSNIPFFQSSSTPLLHYSSTPIFSQSNLPPLPHKFLKGAIRVDAGAGFFCQVPVVLVSEQGRVEGPQSAGPRFYGLNQTFFLVIIEDAIPMVAGFNGELSVSFFTESADEGLGRHSQETGNDLRFSAIEADTAFTVTAVTASFAFKGFHRK